MRKEMISALIMSFEEAAFKGEGLEFWFARRLQILLGYDRWENFHKVIEKAITSCERSNIDPLDHFREVRNMVDIGSGAKREVDDLILSRYACYLIAQNGDPRKEEIAFAQSYFAVQTRKQEVIEERISLRERLEAREKLTASETELSKLIYERGVDDSGFARIRSKGDYALFGGKDTKMMKVVLNIPENRPLADFLPTVTIAAKNLATEMTNLNVRKNNLDGEPNITQEHVKNNKDVRDVLIKNDIIPENLPAEEDIKKLQRRVKSSERVLISKSIKKGG